MNDFTAKKLGEVLAFSRVLAATLDRGGDALSRVMPEDLLENARTTNQRLMSALEEEEAYSAVRDAILAKAEKTQIKLTDMQNLYLTSDEDWNDPAELMEWLGFFEGAAIVHWRLVVGAARSSGEASLASLASAGHALHTELLSSVEAAIEQHGEERAKL